MNENLITALIGFGGSALGAVAALAGAWLSNRHNEKIERVRRSEERRDAGEEKLKQAYADWIRATRKSLTAFSDLAASLRAGNGTMPEDSFRYIKEHFTHHPIEIQLTESDPEALSALSNATDAFHNVVRKVSEIDLEAPDADIFKAPLSEAHQQLHNLTRALRKRFCWRA